MPVEEEPFRTETTGISGVSTLGMARLEANSSVALVLDGIEDRLPFRVVAGLEGLQFGVHLFVQELLLLQQLFRRQLVQLKRGLI